MQVSEDAEGVVSFQYRTQPDEPPDVPTIQKQMAIVAWQPGPNRIVQIPDMVPASPPLHPAAAMPLSHFSTMSVASYNPPPPTHTHTNRRSSPADFTP